MAEQPSLKRPYGGSNPPEGALQLLTTKPDTPVMDIDISEVESAEADLTVAKDAFFADRDDADLRVAFNQAKRDVVAVRSSWRAQEVAEGRRTGLVGGDAVPEEN